MTAHGVRSDITLVFNYASVTIACGGEKCNRMLLSVAERAGISRADLRGGRSALYLNAVHQNEHILSVITDKNKETRISSVITDEIETYFVRNPTDKVYEFVWKVMVSFYVEDTRRPGAMQPGGIQVSCHTEGYLCGWHAWEMTMKLLFKQRFFSWFDSYDIYDEAGNTVYVVKGQLSWGHKLVIYDAAGREIGMVVQRVLTLLPKFELYKNGICVGCLSKEFTFLKPQYNIDYNGWHGDGSIMEWDYSIPDRGSNLVATVSKELFHMTDTYVIDVRDPDDALDALMFVLAIDAEKCSRN